MICLCKSSDPECKMLTVITAEQQEQGYSIEISVLCCYIMRMELLYLYTEVLCGLHRLTLIPNFLICILWKLKNELHLLFPLYYVQINLVVALHYCFPVFRSAGLHFS